MFKIIINCGRCESFIEKCLGSVLSQLGKWEAYVTCDPCGDDTLDRAESFTTDPRVKFHRNWHRRYSMWNQISAIRRSGTDPEDIIVTLDGDDWFSRPDALETIARTYRTHHCWMTYGSWVSNSVTEYGEMWPAYPDGLTDFRGHPWLATAVRTWKRWLWELVDDNDFRYNNGEYFRVAEDRAIMLPMLEMCGTERAKHIPESLMVYNQLPSNRHPELEAEGDANVKVIHSRPPYWRIESMTKFETVTFRCRGIDWTYKVWLDDGGWYWSVGSVDGTAGDEQEAQIYMMGSDA